VGDRGSNHCRVPSRAREAFVMSRLLPVLSHEIAVHSGAG